MKDVNAEIKSGKVKLTRYAIGFNKLTMAIFFSGDQLNTITFFAVAGIFSIPAAIALAANYSFWWVLGIVGLPLFWQMRRIYYESTLLDLARKNEAAFCFLFYVTVNRYVLLLLMGRLNICTERLGLRQVTHLSENGNTQLIHGSNLVFCPYLHTKF